MTTYQSTIPKPVLIAGGVALITALGAYLLYGSDEGPRRRRQIKSLFFRIKADVMDEIDKLKSINEEAYKQVMAEIKERYSKLKNMDATDVAALVLKVQKHWKEMQRDIDKTTAKAEMAMEDIEEAAQKVNKPKKATKKRTRSKKSGASNSAATA